MTRRIKLLLMSAIAAAGVACGAASADAQVVTTTTVYGPVVAYPPVATGCVRVVTPVPVPPPPVRVVVPGTTVIVPTPYRPWVGPVVVRRW
jgi:hypothetical protein